MDSQSEVVLFDVGSGAEDGINFHDDFTEELVGEALNKLAWELSRAQHPCYCLRMEVQDNTAFFRPFGSALPAVGERQPHLPASVPLHALVEEVWTWPLIALRTGSPSARPDRRDYPTMVAEFLGRINWHAQIRVQQGARYVGYFKIVGLESELPPKHDLQAAFYSTKLYVTTLIAHRKASQALVSPQFQQRLHETIASISQLAASDRRMALRHVADMLTSHLGARWNRAACFGEVAPGKLECLWAQGGDGTDEWSATVQGPVARAKATVGDLARSARENPAPSDDRYLRAAASQSPLIIDKVFDSTNDNVLARLWRHSGNVAKLPSENQEWELCDAPLPHMSSVDREALSSGGPLAAVFTRADRWVKAVIEARPEDKIFVSANGEYFALPWIDNGVLIGIWVVDIAYWGVRRSQAPNAPSLALTHQILRAVAPVFDQHRANYWGRSCEAP